MCHFSGLLCTISGLFAMIALASGRATLTSDLLLKPQISDSPSGESVISIEEAPWQVSVQVFHYMVHQHFHYCSGSIISERWLLTAVHCIAETNIEAISVQVGNSSNRNDGHTIKVKRVVQHEEYEVSSKLDYDFSLLELEEPITFDATKQPIDLPDDSENVVDNTLCTVTGWALNDVDLDYDQLKTSNISIVNQQNCASKYDDDVTKVTQRMICAGFTCDAEERHVCDGGAPLICENKLIGISSWGNDCRLPNWDNSPAVFSRVQAVRSWIRSNTGI